MNNFKSFTLEDNGPDIAELKQVLNDTNPKMLYAIPNFQNPTGITWRNTKRKNYKRYWFIENIVHVVKLTGPSNLRR